MCRVECAVYVTAPLPSPPPTQAGTLHLPIGGGNTLLGRAHCTLHCTLHTALHGTLHTALYTAHCTAVCAQRGMDWFCVAWTVLYCSVLHCTGGLHPDSVVNRLAEGEQLGPEWCTIWVYTLGWEWYYIMGIITGMWVIERGNCDWQLWMWEI